MTIDEIIKEIDSKSMGRTRYAGQELKWDEALVAEIRSLREAVRVLGAFVSVPAKYHKDRGVWCSAECLGKCEDCVNEQRRIDAMKAINSNPIAAAAVEAARNQAKGTQ